MKITIELSDDIKLENVESAPGEVKMIFANYEWVIISIHDLQRALRMMTTI